MDKKEKVFGTWISTDLIRKIHIFCAKNEITIKSFIEQGSILMFEKEGRYGKKSTK